MPPAARRLLVLAASPVLLAVGPFVEGRRQPRRTVERGSLDPAHTTAPIQGRLFYEDHRTLGRHQTRLDHSGEPGRPSGERTRWRQLFLGAHYMTVDIFEVDEQSGPGCSPLAWVGSATVGADGRFTTEVPTDDPCSAETAPRYVVAAQTSSCEDDALCFFVGRRPRTAHTLWFGLGRPFEGPELPDLLFRPRGHYGASVEAQAANHYASLVDGLLALHVEAGIPFRREEFGPVSVRFPSPWSNGQAPRSDLIDANNMGWPKGGLVLHEYGHIVHRRAWGGDYAGYPAPVQSWRGGGGSEEVPFIALKEGWANFTTAYVTGRCFVPRYDSADTLVSVKREVPGLHFPQNHRRALCDWVDSLEDQRAGTQRGDTLSTDLYTLWQALDETDALWPEHAEVPGLDMCDLAATYVVNGSLAGRPARFDAIAGVLETNDIDCPGLMLLPIRQVAATPGPRD